MRYPAIVAVLLALSAPYAQAEEVNALACRDLDSLSRLAERAKESYASAKALYMLMPRGDCWTMNVSSSKNTKRVQSYGPLAVQPNERYPVDIVRMLTDRGVPLFVAVRADR